MDASQLEAIIEGRHRDPFAVLGPHDLEVRAWLPQAAEASLVIGNKAIKMECIHPSGFYLVILDAPPKNYRIRIKLYSGEFFEFEDPYRFPPLLTSFELYLHGEGTNHEAYKTLGAHPVISEGVPGVRFALWAPNADVVSVLGDFNGWDRTRHPMRQRDGGIWEIFMPGLGEGDHYKYSVLSKNGSEQFKCDPYGFFAEVPPKTASIVWGLSNYAWQDETWMTERPKRQWLREAVSIYEVHLESWIKGLSYRELAYKLVEYAKRMGYTHLELMPIMEHPFTGSWGLSGNRLFCTHFAVWNAGRFSIFRRLLPPGRPRRDSRLGARPLPPRRAWTLSL